MNHRNTEAQRGITNVVAFSDAFRPINGWKEPGFGSSCYDELMLQNANLLNRKDAKDAKTIHRKGHRIFYECSPR